MDSNQLDRWFRDHVTQRLRRPLYLSDDKLEFWSNVTKKVVLALSDIQLVTGISMLLVGFVRIPANNGQISVYHMSIISDLAAFSSSTHLSTLGVLRPDYFETHLFLRIIRAFGMALTYILLSIANIWTGDEYWYDNFNCPLECEIGSGGPYKIGGGNEVAMIYDLVFLTVTYISLFFSNVRSPQEILGHRRSRDY